MGGRRGRGLRPRLRLGVGALSALLRAPALPALLALAWPAAWPAAAGPAAPAVLAPPASAAAAAGGCAADPEAGIDWPSARVALWAAVETRSAAAAGAFGELALQAQHSARPSACVAGLVSAAALAAVGSAGAGARAWEASDRYLDPFALGVPLAALALAGFPAFGALEWLAAEAAPQEGHAADACSDRLSRRFRALLEHHVRQSTAVPVLEGLEYIAAATSARSCELGVAAALLAVAGAAIPNGVGGAGVAELAAGPASLAEALAEVLPLVDRAEGLLRGLDLPPGAALRALGTDWPIWTLLHRLSRAVARPQLARPPPAPQLATGSPGGCIVMIYAFPTDEIRRDTAQAVQALQRHYFTALGVQYPLFVFTDPGTAAAAQAELGALTSAPVVPAVIPADELSRRMFSYSCSNGFDCATDAAAPASTGHRGNVNATQFWSADYLRISRYTAGPLFLHPALDACGVFLKIDTDFYLTAPILKDPIQEIRREGARLAYWQIHVQGQRQEGYMDAAVAFLQARGLRIRSRAFYARGQFEEKAARLGIPLEEVPQALEAATVLYGCLFGGEVAFFREPLYRDFFDFMDGYRGFETRGWSNQFFLGTAAAAFLFPSQVRRLYVSGRHQESKIDVANGNVTEYLTGATHAMLR